MFIRRTVIAGIMLAAPLAFAAPAMATPNSIIDCAPCASVPSWEKLASSAPWETVWPGGDTKGPWEKAFSGGAWEKATSGGAWEKVFPPAPSE